MNKEFIIPVDSAIDSFIKHIDANPRTILSSRFGDGKSFFLKKLNEDPELKEKYEFLTIYPVNYQVVGNKDIFELIKRDVLYQLIIHNMIDDSVKFTENEALSWFLYTKGFNVVVDLISNLSDVGLSNDECEAVLKSIKTIKLFKSIKSEIGKVKKKFEAFKEKNTSCEDDYIDTFIEKTGAHFLYESDVITSIIKRSVKSYRDKTDKKVVLFIEDMDRIDPAHLFRILNILSAHMDDSYKIFIQPNNTLVANKFGLDNIVLVIDYENLTNIYHHFYGENTEFQGYITKFLSSIPFEYSLSKTRNEYVIRQIAEITNLDVGTIASIFTDDILSKTTIREVVQSFSIQNQIPVLPKVKYNGEECALDISILKVMAILKRLRISKDEIFMRILKLREIDFGLFVKHICPYSFFLRKVEKNEFIFIIDNKDNPYIGLHNIQIGLNPANGTANIFPRQYYELGERSKVTDYSKYLDVMYSFIA